MNNALIPLLFKSFFKPFDAEFELFSDTNESDKTQHTKQNCDESNDSTEIGIGKTKYPIHSDIIHDGLTFGRQTEFKLTIEMINRLKEITAETY